MERRRQLFSIVRAMNGPVLFWSIISALSGIHSISIEVIPTILETNILVERVGAGESKAHGP